jgi:hypothetical protein
VTTVTASAPLASSGGATPNISINLSTGSGSVVLATSPTIVTPTIASFVNATHSHANAAGGGTLNASAIAAGTLALARGGTNADLSGTGAASSFLKQSSLGAAISVGTIASADITTALLTPPPIGASSQNTGAFTTLAATSISLFGSGGAGQFVKQSSLSGNFSTAVIVASDLSAAAADGFLVDTFIFKHNPSLVFQTPGADTDFWIGVQDDSGGTDNDAFQIGKTLTPGTTPFLTITYQGKIGTGTTPDAGSRLTVKDAGLSGTTGGEQYIAAVHADDDGPYLAGFFNDTVSSTIPVFQYFGWSSSGGGFVSGDFEMGNPAAKKVAIYTNGVSNPRLIIDGSGNITFQTGTFFPAQYTTGGRPVYVKGAVAYDTTLGKLIVGGLTDWEAGAIYPTTAFVPASFMKITAGGGTRTISGVSGQYLGVVRPSTHANGDAFSLDFFIKAGTYTFHRLLFKASDSGKVDWTLDGASIVTGEDHYNGVNTFGVENTTGSIVITGDGMHTLVATVNGKNGSSSSYYTNYAAVWFD